MSVSHADGPHADASGTWVLGDRTVRRLGFGSMRLTADPDRDRAIGVLRRARELGVDHVDTAAFYVSRAEPWASARARGAGRPS